MYHNAYIRAIRGKKKRKRKNDRSSCSCSTEIGWTAEQMREIPNCIFVNSCIQKQKYHGMYIWISFCFSLLINAQMCLLLRQPQTHSQLDICTHLHRHSHLFLTSLLHVFLNTFSNEIVEAVKVITEEISTENMFVEPNWNSGTTDGDDGKEGKKMWKKRKSENKKCGDWNMDQTCIRTVAQSA